MKHVNRMRAVSTWPTAPGKIVWILVAETLSAGPFVWVREVTVETRPGDLRI
jgi:hypothetical protein